MKVLIVPCGENVDSIPRFLKKDSYNQTMIVKSLSGLDLNFFDEIKIILFNQESEYIKEELSQELSDNGIKATIHEIDKTNSVVETIYSVTKKSIIDYELYVKDFDDYVEVNEPLNPNSVYISSLNNGNVQDVDKKSYVTLDPINTILNIVEKDVISSNFCVGLYSFKSVYDFNNAVEDIKINEHKNLYISHVIYQMILDGQYFTGRKVSVYEDWGSTKLWENSNQTISEKKKGTLHIFGCSHSTWFEPSYIDNWIPIENGSTHDWSHELASKLGFNLTNHAVPDSGIQVIFQRFMESVIRKEITKDDIVIFNASYPFRFKLEWLRTNHGFLGGDGAKAQSLRGPDTRDETFHKYCKELGFEIDDDFLFLEWLNTQKFVHKVLDLIGCRWYHWQLEEMKFLQIWHRKIRLMKSKYDISNKITGDEFFLEQNLIQPPIPYKSWFDWIKDNGWRIENKGLVQKDSHIDLKGHQQFANYLYKRIIDDQL